MGPHPKRAQGAYRDIKIHSFHHHTHTHTHHLTALLEFENVLGLHTVFVVVVQVSAILYLLKKRLKGESVVNEQVFLQGGHDIFLQQSTHHEQRTKQSIRINQSN